MTSQAETGVVRKKRTWLRLGILVVCWVAGPVVGFLIGQWIGGANVESAVQDGVLGCVIGLLGAPLIFSLFLPKSDPGDCGGLM